MDKRARREKGAGMASDDDIYTTIKALVEEEHSLSGRDAAQRRRHLEEQLDQCWDLLRQRQARREFGEDADAASPRPVDEVESYLQ